MFSNTNKHGLPLTRSAGVAPREVFLKSWNDFFYPSDENSLLLIPKSSKVIFSFDDMFFYGDLLKI